MYKLNIGNEEVEDVEKRVYLNELLSQTVVEAR